jgi:hypothetical protein
MSTITKNIIVNSIIAEVLRFIIYLNKSINSAHITRTIKKVYIVVRIISDAYEYTKMFET